MPRFVTRFAELFGDRGREGIIYEEFQGAGRSGISFPYRYRSVAQCFADVFGLEIRIRSQDVFIIHTFGYHLYYGGNGDAQATDARNPAHLLWIHRDAGKRHTSRPFKRSIVRTILLTPLKINLFATGYGSHVGSDHLPLASIIRCPGPIRLRGRG